MRLRRAWYSNHTLGRDPGEGDLAQSAALTISQLLDLFDDRAVLVKVLSLEFGRCCYM